MRVSVFVGARWRQGWVKGQVPGMSSLSPQPPAPGHGLLCAALLPLAVLFILLRNARLQQNWLHHIFQRSLPPRKDSLRQEKLIQAVLILTASSLRCRGGGETSPAWGKGPGFQGHLCMQQPLSRKTKAQVCGQWF